MINETFQRRFDELEKSVLSLPFKATEYDCSTQYVSNDIWLRWATSAQNLILAVFGPQSPHYINFVDALKKCRGYADEVNPLKGIFLSAKDDFQGGYVFNVELRISGEVFGDFVALARTALSEGQKDVAAVLACAALEDALKRYAIANEIEVNQKTMQEIINALKSGGFVSGAQKSMLESMPRIRNYAMHAEWAKVSEVEVSSVIGYVEQFLLTKFSSIQS